MNHQLISNCLQKNCLTEFIGELMTRLENHLSAGTKPDNQRLQPPSLYSTGPQETREETIAKCQVSSRGILRRNWEFQLNSKDRFEASKPEW